MTHEEFIKNYGLGEIINGVLVIRNGQISGNVDLRNLTTLPEHTTFNNSGPVDLSNLTTLPEHVTFNNGEWVCLRNLTTLPEHTTFNNGGWIDLSNLTTLPEHVTFNNGGWVYLNNLTTLPEHTTFNNSGPVDLIGLTTLPEHTTFNNDGAVNLRKLTALPEHTTFNNSGWIYLNNLTTPETLHYFKNWGDVIFKNSRLPPPKDMERNSHEKIIVCDGIRGEVIKRGKRFFKLKLHSGKSCFLVTDGDGLYAHGDTIKEAKEDLIYKIKDSSSEDDYKDLTLDSTLSLVDAIKCYRVITGACSFGVKDFVERNNLKYTQEITIQHIIDITNGSYGHDAFNSFFNNPTSHE